MGHPSGSDLDKARLCTPSKKRLKVHLERCDYLHGGFYLRKKASYYATLCIDSTVCTRSQTQQVSPEGTVIWNEDLYIDCLEESKFSVRLYEARTLLWDRLISETMAQHVFKLLPEDEALEDDTACSIRLVALVMEFGADIQIAQNDVFIEGGSAKVVCSL
ncbi:hypothetical protein PENSPDRAFT_656289 [Peniophora sp. CONT]|nr:hypothetical protein PENSPDRAFT_656289 [Peniophora sp. CONT]